MENLSLIYPEIFLGIVAMILLMVGVFNQKSKTVNLVLGLSAVAILISLYLQFVADFNNKGEIVEIFSGAFSFNKFTIFMKILAGLCAASICLVSINNNSFAGSENKNCFEFPVLILLSLIGVNLMISANDLIAVYLGLELLSLSSYVLCGLNRDNALSSEAAVKYFILGALASGLILFGSSLVYGFAGSTNLNDIFAKLGDYKAIEDSLALTLGWLLVLFGFVFKVSAAPMHMWAPDVYSGVSKPVLGYISTAPKVASVAFLVKIIAYQPEYLEASYSAVIAAIAIISMLVGSFAGLRQTNLKRLIAYSSIANIGYLFIALSIADEAAISSALLYLSVYLVTLIGVFAVITNINKDDKKEDLISNLAGFGVSNPLIAFCLSILMFSVAGIPPMAGFFAKFFVFIEAIRAESYVVAVIGVLSSVVACFYYLKIVKTLYFDEADPTVQLVAKYSNFSKVIIFLSIAFSLTMIFYVDRIVNVVKDSVAHLFV